MPPADYRVFQHLHADHAPLYRAILTVFMRSRERFAVHLRNRDVAAQLAADGHAIALDALDAKLRQLVEWNNLHDHPDTASVTTVEDFYRPRFVYQLTDAGEAAERALAFYEEALVQPGDLQSAALAEILTSLQALQRLLSPAAVDEAAILEKLEFLRARFDLLVTRARTFIGSLQRGVELRIVGVSDLLVYKGMLLEYLERFIGDLVVAQAEIAEMLEAFTPAQVDVLLAIAARRDTVSGPLQSAERKQQAQHVWQQRWEGLRSWFISRPAAPAQADDLRAAARAAIPSLLGAIAATHDKRLSRTDRHTDLRTLARWFAQAPSETDAHRLWRAAFGLSPARHLLTTPQSLDIYAEHPVPASTSWRDAPPLEISVRLRTTGRYERRGRPAVVVDRAQARRELARLAELEAAQLAAAQARLAGRGRARLSQLRFDDPFEFGLFLDLLGDALSQRTDHAASIETSSADGTLRVLLEPTGDGVTATIQTSEGALTGPDHFITITSALGASATHPAEAFAP